MITMYESGYSNYVTIPFEPYSSLNTNFGFNYVPRRVYVGSRCYFPKNLTFDDTLGAIQMVYYDSYHNTWDGLPDLYNPDKNRTYERIMYMNPSSKGDTSIRNRIWYTQTVLRDYLTDTSHPYSCTVANMAHIKVEDANYRAEDPDYPAWQPCPHRYQDAYWVYNPNSGRMNVTGLTAWALIGYTGDTNRESEFYNIGFNFLYGGTGGYLQTHKAFLDVFDPVPFTSSQSANTYHYGYRGSSSHVSVKTIATFQYAGVTVRFTLLSTVINLLSSPVNYVGIISQPYLNFALSSYFRTSNTSKLLILGAEYHGAFVT